MTDIIASDTAKLELDKLLYVYEIEATSTSTLRYHSGVNSSSANIVWYNYTSPYAAITYTAMPVDMSGESREGMGGPNRVTFVIGTVATTFASDLSSLGIYSYDDLVGKKVTRRTTFAKYINGGTADTNAGSAPVEFPKVTFIIESIKVLTSESITFELTNGFDTEGITIPNRNMSANLCSWIYQGVGAANVGGEYSACYWSDVGTFKPAGHTHTIYFNSEDQPLLPYTALAFPNYATGAVTKDSFYSTASATNAGRRINVNGSITNVTLPNFWQARVSSSSPGAPSDSNSNFRRVRTYTAWANDVSYFTFQTSGDAQYVLHANKVWQAGSSSLAETPGFNAFWKLGDVCGKKLNSCAVRYGMKPKTGASGPTSFPSVDIDTTQALPFGGFPGLGKKYLR